MIIESLLDTDYYKLTQSQVAFHQFPSAFVRYKFKCRNEMKWRPEHHKQLLENIDHFCSLRLDEGELKYLEGLGIFKPSFMEFLRLYSPNRKHITLSHEGDELGIEVAGPWYSTIFFEVPVLAMVSEIYSGKFVDFSSGRRRLEEKLKIHDKVPFDFADFGTRRRNNGAWHEELIERLRGRVGFIGTSNVHLARKFGLKPIGTMAHEFLQVFQAFIHPRLSQKMAFQSWLDEYKGVLGIALTDVIGIDAFLRDFDYPFAQSYQGVRHDSGSSDGWADKVIAHYQKLGIDPRTKTLVFSDGLNFEECARLHEKYKWETYVSFGVGTHLTNDFDDIVPLQIVMKVVECNGMPVAKVSDSQGKGMGSEKYTEYLRKVFEK